VNRSSTTFASLPSPAVDEAAIDRLLSEARRAIGRRARPSELPGVLAGGGLVIDTRYAAQRERDGALTGAIVVERNELEWRLDPTSPHRLPELTGPDQPIVVVCHEGYASSLAVPVLRGLGLTNVTDLEGGYQSWVTS
jgi:rhodanese-related sulfurtransferase